MKEKLYGLFEVSYDYHTWETLNCVSEDVDRLRILATLEEEDSPITTEEVASINFGRREQRHWYIKEVNVI